MNAPISPSKEDLRKFKQCKDIYNLHKSLKVVKQAGDHKAVIVLNRQLCYIIKILSSLKVQKKRVEYFSYINRLRALGLLTIGTPAT